MHCQVHVHLGMCERHAVVGSGNRREFSHYPGELGRAGNVLTSSLLLHRRDTDCSHLKFSKERRALHLPPTPSLAINGNQSIHPLEFAPELGTSCHSWLPWIFSRIITKDHTLTCQTCSPLQQIYIECRTLLQTRYSSDHKQQHIHCVSCSWNKKSWTRFILTSYHPWIRNIIHIQHSQ